MPDGVSFALSTVSQAVPLFFGEMEWNCIKIREPFSLPEKKTAASGGVRRRLSVLKLPGRDYGCSELRVLEVIKVSTGRRGPANCG